MNNNIRQIYNENIECKYDTENSPAKYINNENVCNICRNFMHISQTHYINKKNREAPIICDICFNAPRYHSIIGAYKLHYNVQSRLTNFCQYFVNIFKINKFQKIKPV